MMEPLAVNWIIQRGYSIETQLQADGLSFDAFDIISSVDKTAAEKVKSKIISRLAKNLRADCLEHKNNIDIQKINYGVYCIGLGTGFELNYENRTSRIVYIGSGAVYNRIKSHLRDKLFEFASALRNVPLRFYIADLSMYGDAKSIQRKVEQALLTKFKIEVDSRLPLLNKNKAFGGENDLVLEKGWDTPIQRERGKQGHTTDWLLMAKDQGRWKGKLD